MWYKAFAVIILGLALFVGLLMKPAAPLGSSSGSALVPAPILPPSDAPPVAATPPAPAAVIPPAPAPSPESFGAPLAGAGAPSLSPGVGLPGGPAQPEQPAADPSAPKPNTPGADKLSI